MSIPIPRPSAAAPESEITVIDTARAVVVDRIPLHGIARVFHMAFSADGHLGAAAGLHPKNLIPLAHLEHGGAFADTLTLFGADIGKEPIEVPLDELERYAARPFGVAIAPDKSRIYVTTGGSEIVTVIDVPRLLRFRPHAQAALCPGSLRKRQLRRRAHRRRTRSARPGLLRRRHTGCSSPTGSTTPSA